MCQFCSFCLTQSTLRDTLGRFKGVDRLGILCQSELTLSVVLRGSESAYLLSISSPAFKDNFLRFKSTCSPLSFISEVFTG